jgi:hypothetical protein
MTGRPTPAATGSVASPAGLLDTPSPARPREAAKPAKPTAVRQSPVPASSRLARPGPASLPAAANRARPAPGPRAREARQSPPDPPAREPAAAPRAKDPKAEAPKAAVPRVQKAQEVRGNAGHRRPSEESHRLGRGEKKTTKKKHLPPPAFVSSFLHLTAEISADLWWVSSFPQYRVPGSRFHRLAFPDYRLLATGYRFLVPPFPSYRAGRASASRIIPAP